MQNKVEAARRSIPVAFPKIIHDIVDSFNDYPEVEFASPGDSKLTILLQDGRCFEITIGDHNSQLESSDPFCPYVFPRRLRHVFDILEVALAALSGCRWRSHVAAMTAEETSAGCEAIFLFDGSPTIVRARC